MSNSPRAASVPLQQRSRRCGSVIGVAGLVVALSAAGCSFVNPRFVEERHFGTLQSSIFKLAVLPFYPKPRLTRSTQGSGTQAWEAAALVTRFVTESIARRGVKVIPESDIQLAFAASGQVTPRQDPRAAARVAAAKFGVEAVLLGEVDRYRKREGSAYGSFGPASASFTITLYEAPSGRKLWSARFDQTQPALSSDFFRSTRYPGRGSRFLTVTELAKWGAGLVADELPLGR